MWQGLSAVDIGSTALLGLVVLLLLTDKLIWHKRLENLEKDYKERLRECTHERDRWQKVALDLLGVASKMTTQGEVAVEVLTRLPEHTAEEGEK